MTGYGRLRRLAAAATIPFALAGCGDDPAPDLEPSVETVARLAGDLAGFLGVCQDYYAVVEVGYLRDDPSNKGISLHPAVGDTLLPGVLTCPVVYKESGFAGVDTLAVDYGGGCTATLDGLDGDGSVVVYVSLKPLGGFQVGLDLSPLERGSSALAGDIAMDGERDTVHAAAPSLQIQGGGGTSTVDGFVRLKRLTPLNPGGDDVCLEWRAETGSGSITRGGVNWTFRVQTPLDREDCCPWPGAGALRLDAEGYVPVLVNFGDGTCDAEVEITIGSRIESATLGE